ncbi:enoyl-CoA hydratase [Baekduia soli]|uniref:Enoyl-CoA hydratase n=1 Tax=Baekduia soli TaxID=496014 RepID=A0A5B8U5G2_9ACTN|nr:enoyl-CoA hydratase-related protein [Baekduia soli]QEC48078.1 enoyl-CoA hydratase [Baekduia soli]
MTFTPKPMSYDAITYEVQDGIATIAMNRPDQLNALDAAMERELLLVWDLVDADDDVRAVVVTGRGRAFCAGYDLTNGFDVRDRAVERGTEELRPGDIPRDSGGLICLRMFRCLKPIVGAINGAGVGFGATFPLPMDVRLASEHAKFGYVFSRRGICMDAASSWFLTRAVGMSTALEWAISGRVFGADEALAAGLVREVLPADDLLPAAYETARRMVEHTAPVSVALNRQLLWQMAGATHPMDAHRAESIYIEERAASADAAEGAQSFIEKRPPAFPLTVSRDLPDGTPPFPEPPFDRRRRNPSAG